MHRYGVLSFTDVIVKSSNVGAIKVGLKLGPERLGRYVSRFGFGQTLAPDFRGENAGIVWNPARLDPGAVASVSMGYQVGVTPVQMATAVSSIANGGTLYEPRVVRAIIKDGQRAAIPHKALRRTVSERTAAQLTAIMEAVVERGTAKAAQIDGYTIAGKTGTAHKVINGGYSPSEYNASFVGLPAVAQAGADDHRRHRLAARQGLHGRGRGGADLQARRRSVAAPSGHRADRQPGAAGARGGRDRPTVTHRVAAGQPVKPSRTRRPRRADAGPARLERARCQPYAHARSA